MSLIRLDNVSKFYKSEETVSVGMKKISLSFNLGEFVGVTGESGSGKSTLLNVISGLDGYEDGELYLFDEETSHYTIADWERYRGAYVGFVFQNYNIIDSYTVYQNVMLALEVQGYDFKLRKKRALELIDQVGLMSHKNHKASKLSGGQKQRAVIARALAKDCPVIVADEPTGNLDSESSKQIISLLHEISKNKLVIVVTHDYDQIKHLATRKIKMHDGEVVEDKKIKSYDEGELSTPVLIKTMSFLGLMKFALRNLISTPKKLIFMLLLQILVITVFTVVYTNQIQGIREVGLEQSFTYPNVPQTRVLVERRDGLPFDADDYNYLESFRHVRHVYPSGANFFDRQRINLEGSFGSGGWYYIEGTDASESLSPRDVEGRLPTARNEIVVSSYFNSIQIGQSLKLTSGYNPITEQSIVIETFIVVGIDKLDRRIIYFSDAFLNDISEQQTTIDQTLYEDNRNYFTWGMQALIGDNELWITQGPVAGADAAMNGSGEQGPIQTLTVTFSARSVRGRLVEHTRTLEVRTYGDPYELRIPIALLQEIVEIFLEEVKSEYTIVPRNISSVSISGYFGGSQLINRIDNERFKVYYPANISSPIRDFLVFFLSLIALVFLSLFGIFLYSMVHAVTRNLMNARKKDFAIFRSIGANQKTLARMVVLEQVIISAIGFVFTMIILNVLRELIPLITNTLLYMRLQDYAILLGAFLFFGAWLGLRFNKKVFGQSVIETLSMSKGD